MQSEASSVIASRLTSSVLPSGRYMPASSLPGQSTLFFAPIGFAVPFPRYAESDLVEYGYSLSVVRDNGLVGIWLPTERSQVELTSSYSHPHELTTQFDSFTIAQTLL